MKKYYIGFMVLMAVTLASLVYALSQAGNAKADKATDQAVEQVGPKMDAYISDRGSVPKSLDDLGIKNVPKTVTYRALGSTKYKICFDYHSASSGFDAGWASLLTGGITGSDQMSSPSSSGGYFDSSVETSHKKGDNCQTVDSSYYNYQLQPSSGIYQSGTGSSSSCAQKSYTVEGTATVASVNTATSQITFSPENQYVYDQNGGQVQLTAKTYDSGTLFCGQDTKKTDISAIKAGQTVFVGLVSASSPTVAEIDAY